MSVSETTQPGRFHPKSQFTVPSRGQKGFQSSRLLGDGLRPHVSDPALLAYKRWLRGLRRHLGLTQEQLGRQLGVNEKTVAHWESDRDPRIGANKTRRLLRRLGEANRYQVSPI